MKKTLYYGDSSREQEVKATEEVNNITGVVLLESFKEELEIIYSFIKYLQTYVNEFYFRFNNRNGNMFDLVLRQAVG